MTEQPDNLPVYDASGQLICFRPNYAKPGVAERVARECFEDDLRANPPRDNVSLLLQGTRIVRFENKMGAKYGRQVAS